MNNKLSTQSPFSKRSNTTGIIIPRFLKCPKKTTPSLPQADFNAVLRRLSEPDRELAMERVSILEFDGRLSRDEAEKKVIDFFLKKLGVSRESS